MADVGDPLQRVLRVVPDDAVGASVSYAGPDACKHHHVALLLAAVRATFKIVEAKDGVMGRKDVLHQGGAVKIFKIFTAMLTHAIRMRFYRRLDGARVMLVQE